MAEANKKSAKAADSNTDTVAAASSGEEVKNAESSVPVRVVEHPGKDADEEFLRQQDAAYLEYRTTGVNRGYIDPLRDQEPDIAPEFGVAPHPEMFNPAPPSGAWTGVALDPNANPVVASFEEKNKNDANFVEEVQAGADEARKQVEADRNEEPDPTALTAIEEGQIAARIPDESPKASLSNVRATRS